LPETETTLASTEVSLIAAGESRAGGSWMKRIEEHPAWPSLARVPETLTALIPLRQFTVRSLLLLDKGQMIASDRSLSEDIPMKIGAVQIAWGEFEVVEHRMALRVTRVA
jgi:flagellar motor switch protein FliM